MFFLLMHASTVNIQYLKIMSLKSSTWILLPLLVPAYRKWVLVYLWVLLLILLPLVPLRAFHLGEFSSVDILVKVV